MINYENGGYYGLLVMIISVLVISIILICVSGMKNPPGFYTGVIVMIFSFLFLGIGIFGEVMVKNYGIYFWVVIGGLFIFILCMLIVGMMRTPVQENFPEGPCEINGNLGYMYNGKCISSLENTAANYQEELEECKKKGKEMEKKCEPEEENEEGFSGLNMAGPTVGICEYKENGVRKFGYSHPNFGARCVSSERMDNMIRENPGNLVKVNVTHSVNPFQSTACFGYPQEDIMRYDLECKKKFGGDFGVKLIEGFNCPENDFKGVCEKNWQMGEKLEKDSTRCVPIGSDMNGVCQRKNLREKNEKYLKMGFKEIKFAGCPEGTQRALCDGNFYDGKELYENTTSPFPQTENPDRKCKEKFGPLAFSSEIISDNCAVGYVRAKCKTK